MKRKLEEKILQKLQDKVFERDNELQLQKDHKEVRESTKEALAEMTSLSQKEVDEIARQVHDEVYQKHHTQQRIILIAVSLILILSAIYAIRKLTEKPPIHFEENFADLKNGWALYDEFEYKRYIENGYYNIEANKDGWHFWEYINFEFPEHYKVELKTKWFSGVEDGYGLTLLESSKTYFYFFIKADGSARYGFKENDVWKTEDEYSDGYANASEGDEVENIITVEVNGDNFQYFINNNLYKSGTLEGLNASKLGVAASGIQHVGFDWIKVTDLSNENNGVVLLDENFEEKDKGWTEAEELEKKSWLADNMLYFQHNIQDYCDWSNIDLPENISTNFSIDATMYWKAGERGDFGLMLMENNSDYYSFEVSSNGKARFLKHYGNEYNFIGDYKQTGLKFKKADPFYLHVEAYHGRIKFLLNNIEIYEGKGEGFDYQKVGFRVCDKQTVAIDKLVIHELKKN